LGFRGAARYLAENFAKAFEMECIAMKRVREEMGLTNVELMIPIVRALGQAEKVVVLLEKYGLKRGEKAYASS
jgi:pyruvate,water dikinase